MVKQNTRFIRYNEDTKSPEIVMNRQPHDKRIYIFFFEILNERHLFLNNENLGIIFDIRRIGNFSLLLIRINIIELHFGFHVRA